MKEKKIKSRVYALMSLGLVISGVVAYAFASILELYNLLYTETLDGTTTLAVAGWVILLAPIVVFLIGIMLPKRTHVAVLFGIFIIFSTLMGASLNSIFLVYEMRSIINAFFITAGTFAAISVYALITKRDITALGTIFIMLLTGIVISMVVNIFMQNQMFDCIISIVSVIVFAGITAYDTQVIEERAFYCREGELNKVVIGCALSLYLDFINLFLNILTLLGKRK